MEKQREKQIDALRSLSLSNKTWIKKMRVYFQKNLLNDLIIYKLQDIIKLKDIIELNELGHESKRGKTCSFSKYTLPTVF